MNKPSPIAVSLHHSQRCTIIQANTAAPSTAAVVRFSPSSSRATVQTQAQEWCFDNANIFRVILYIKSMKV